MSVWERPVLLTDAEVELTEGGRECVGACSCPEFVNLAAKEPPGGAAPPTEPGPRPEIIIAEINDIV